MTRGRPSFAQEQLGSLLDAADAQERSGDSPAQADAAAAVELTLTSGEVDELNAHYVVRQPAGY